MYTLHFLPSACSLATQVILRELNQAVTLKEKAAHENFTLLNPVNAVPVLEDGNTVLREGAGIILYLLDKHQNTMMPEAAVAPAARLTAIENILFANATMHPAYGRLFFIAEHLADGPEKDKAFLAASNAINHLWSVVEQKLDNLEGGAAYGPFLGGAKVSAADILLTVYSRWGQFFPVEINIPAKAQAMVDTVLAMDNFKLALAEEDKFATEAA